MMTNPETQVEKISCVSMDVAPVRNKSDDPWLRQEIEGGMPRRQKEFWDRARCRRLTGGMGGG